MGFFGKSNPFTPPVPNTDDFVAKDGSTPLSGNLDADGNTIINLANPVNPQEPVTLDYFNNNPPSGVADDELSNIAPAASVNFNSQKLTGVADPTNPSDVVTKNFFDSNPPAGAANIPLDNILPTADVDFNSQKLVSVADPTNPQDVVTLNYFINNPGGGANKALSNLNLTAINQDLRWGISGTSRTIANLDNPAGSVGTLFIRNGAGISGFQANIDLRTGSAIDPSGPDTGEINLVTGSNTQGSGANIDTGEITLRTGQINNGGESGTVGGITLQGGSNLSSVPGSPTGPILIRSGSASGPNNSGSITVQSGNPGGTGISGSWTGGSGGSGTVGSQSGNVNLQSGPAGISSGQWIAGSGSANGGSSGIVELTSGNATGTQSGRIFINSGSAVTKSGEMRFNSGDASGGASGVVRVFTGEGDGGNSGFLQLSTGASVTDNSGNISISTGSAPNNSGNISLSTGTAGGTKGNISLSAQTISLNSFSTFSSSLVNIAQGTVQLQPSGNLLLNPGGVVDFNDSATQDFVVQSGNTASRPGGALGKLYFDTTLGYLIAHNGTNWVDGSGSVV